jgi:16S rRNA (guanine(966)-N(2))-methyltransferase RsmD
VRIIRGTLKSRRFSPPKGFPSRPTTDFAKEGLFNVLENKFSFIDLKILDLCAGTGNISLEFASREAGTMTCVDSHYNCVRFIQKMIDENELKAVMQVVKADVRDFLRRASNQYDLIFADPPYEAAFHDEIVRLIQEKKLLTENGIAIIEHSKRTDLSNLPGYSDTRSYGNVYFSFFSPVTNE